MLRQSLAVGLPILMVAVLALIWNEIRLWRHGHSLISPRRFALRMIGGGVLFALIGAIFLGLFVLDISHPRQHLVLFSVYWMTCLVLLFALMFLSVADMKEVETRQSEAERAMWREFARQLAGLPPDEQKKEEAKPDGQA
jgi:hypothetical protein